MRVITDIWKKLGAQLAAKGVSNDQIDLVNSQTVSADQYGEYCTVFVALYREIARLPPDRAAILDALHAGRQMNHGRSSSGRVKAS